MRHYFSSFFSLFFFSPAIFFFFFNDTATTEIYTLSLHDALPTSFDADRVRREGEADGGDARERWGRRAVPIVLEHRDRKSTRLNSSHSQNSYAVFCLKKKKKNNITNNEHEGTK